MDNLIERIASRQEKLKEVATQLKEYFVGLDNVIDKIIASIAAWYCTPEFLTRPTIVCLWGLTGNGKTDLVRRLVKGLDFTDNFVEIQLTNKGSSQHTYSSTLQGLLTSSNISSEESGILLLDEIQRFRSVDQEGKDIHDYVFQDLWMLLSDGSFGSASDNKQQVLELLMEAIYWDDYQQAQKGPIAPPTGKKKKKVADEEDEEDKIESRRKFKLTYWNARQLKRRLKLQESIEDIMKWDSRKKMDILTQKMSDKSIYNQEVYSKLLVFVSGNLDEAYKMADQTDESDIDADLFHKHSLRINMLTIKAALRNRFKPEQIARFGNNHIIYHSLSKDSYREIIKRKANEVLNKISEKSGVMIVPDESVYEAIYRNGVFPVQGTRPLFSTISCFFESALPIFTLKALEAGVDKLCLAYKGNHLQAQINNTLVQVKNEGDLDKIKETKRNENAVRRVSVHEAGHAVAYALNFGLVPTQVAVVLASDDKNGFVGIHVFDQTRDQMLKLTAVYLAGRAAEELVFGAENLSGGGQGDLEKATSMVAHYVRVYGMHDLVSRQSTAGSGHALYSYADLRVSNKKVEEILREQKKNAEELVKHHSSLLKALSDHLFTNEKIGPKDFIGICAKYGVNVAELDAKEIVYPKYNKIYSNFCKG